MKIEHRQRHAAGGFTLLELLVAIAVFAVLGVMAVGALSAVMRADDTVQTQQSRLAQVQFAVAILERDVSQLVVRPVRDAFGDASPAVAAGREGIEFTRGGRPNPLSTKRSTLERVGYRHQGRALVRSAWPVLDRGPGAEATQDELIDGVVDLSVRWRDDQGRWLEYWPPAGAKLDAWPTAAEFRLTLEDWGTIRRLIPLVDAPAKKPPAPT